MKQKTKAEVYEIVKEITYTEGLPDRKKAEALRWILCVICNNATDDEILKMAKEELDSCYMRVAKEAV